MVAIEITKKELGYIRRYLYIQIRDKKYEINKNDYVVFVGEEIIAIKTKLSGAIETLKDYVMKNFNKNVGINRNTLNFIEWYNVFELMSGKIYKIIE